MPYPIVLNLSDKLVLVVGGGSVATKRIEGLLGEVAAIRVVAPEASEAVANLAAANEIDWLRRAFEPHDLDGAFLVHAATDDREVNGTVTELAQRRGVLVCCADDPEGGSFLTPSTVARGSLLIALTTGGESPTLTAVLRERLEEQFGPEYDLWVQLFGRLRKTLQGISGAERRKTIVRSILDSSQVGALIATGSLDVAETEARRCI
jgi:precorrin-2 dehydrogenase/sirohydrochlorin ferrochelatase